METDNKTTVQKIECTLSSCKICLGDEMTDLDNPLITPCQCSGSMKYIHLDCLRHWVKQRVNIVSTQTITSISWKTFSCELCKSPYPFAVYFNGKIHELITMEIPMFPYMVLESIIKDSEESNGLYIVKFFPKSNISIVFLYNKNRDAIKKLIGNSMMKVSRDTMPFFIMTIAMFT